MNKAHKKVKIVCGVAGVLFFIPMFFIAADTSSVTNVVSSSASSGGNSAKGGEVVEGTTSTDVFIKTVVDGKVVEFITEHTDNTGENIQKEVFYENGTVEVTTKGEAGTNKPSLKPEKDASTTEKIVSNVEEGMPGDTMDVSVDTSMETRFSFARFISQIMAYVFNIFTK